VTCSCFTPVREFTPNVVEPSFGLGRILYVLLEHSFWSREQDVERGVTNTTCCRRRSDCFNRQVLSLPAMVAPTKVLIVPLSAREEFSPLVKEVCASDHDVRYDFLIHMSGSVEVATSWCVLACGRLEHLHREALCEERRAGDAVRGHARLCV
jgi:glycyl-tRNA synthetase (class II)